MKWIKRIVFSLVVIALLAFGGAWLWLRSSKPVYDGELKLEGLQSKVDVYFDDYGVPHIYAQNKHDLYMAFGYVHAQDRLFQMEMLRRAGSGRLAEIIGKPMLKIDKMFRTLGLCEYAKESADRFESQKGTPMYEDVQAYLSGVNQFVQNGDTPPEYSIIGIEKQPFTPYDIFCITGAMSFSFSQAQKTDPLVNLINTKYGQNKHYLDDLALWHDSTETYMRSSMPDTTNGKPMAALRRDIQSAESMLSFASAMEELEQLLPYAPLQGSNSWVVSGKKTKSKEVLFCNDTHIGYMLPQTWYEAHLNCPDFEHYGHFMSGVPFALVGRNRELSWGLTMLLNDDMDFYKERINPSNTQEVWQKDQYVAAELRKYTIKVKGQADTIVEVLVTPHGPVINGIFDGFSPEPISMFWTYTKFPNRTLDALYGMNNAHNMVDFEKNLPLVHAPGLNINYGDAEGNVAWWACAALIERPAHINPWTILDGTSGVDDPIGFYPFEKNPRCINPEWGYIYSANDWPDKVNGEWYPGYYKPQYRADRIRSLIEKKNDWDLESIKSVMNDHKNVMDSMIMSTFADILVKNAKVSNSAKGRALDIMDWDGSYDPISPSPTLFNAMVYNYLHLACADEMGAEGFKLFLATHQFQRAQSKLLFTENSPWWDNVNTPEVETRAQIIEQAYLTSVDFLSEKFGSNPKIWNWRKAATLELKHPLGEVAIFRPFFNVGPDPIYGGNETILQAGFKLDSTSEYKVFFGSQMRIMLDFANVDSSLNVTPSGQSGHIMSKHFADQAELYREMKFRPQWMKKKDGWDHLIFLGN